MNPLSNATTPASGFTLGAGATSQAFMVQHGFGDISLTGTFDSETVTMQHSPTGLTADFTTYVIPDESGAPANVTFTEPVTKLFVASSHTFRFVVSSGGGSPAVKIYVGGEGVVLK